MFIYVYGVNIIIFAIQFFVLTADKQRAQFTKYSSLDTRANVCRLPSCYVLQYILLYFYYTRTGRVASSRPPPPRVPRPPTRSRVACLLTLAPCTPTNRPLIIQSHFYYPEWQMFSVIVVLEHTYALTHARKHDT